MRDIVKTGLILFIIAAVAALALGLSNLVTEEAIAEQKENAANKARQDVLPKAQEFVKKDIEPEYQSSEKSHITEIFEGKSGGTTVGYTLKVLTKGFGGDVELIVGISTENNIEKVAITSHAETPGLGAKAVEASFLDQYHGKGLDANLVVVKGTPSKDVEIQAITGATITSDAVTDGVNLAKNYYKQVLAGGGEEQ